MRPDRASTSPADSHRALYNVEQRHRETQGVSDHTSPAESCCGDDLQCLQLAFEHLTQLFRRPWVRVECTLCAESVDDADEPARRDVDLVIRDARKLDRQHQPYSLLSRADVARLLVRKRPITDGNTPKTRHEPPFIPPRPVKGQQRFQTSTDPEPSLLGVVEPRPLTTRDLAERGQQQIALVLEVVRHHGCTAVRSVSDVAERECLEPALGDQLGGRRGNVAAASEVVDPTWHEEEAS